MKKRVKKVKINLAAFWEFFSNGKHAEYYVSNGIPKDAKPFALVEYISSSGTLVFLVEHDSFPAISIETAENIPFLDPIIH